MDSRILGLDWPPLDWPRDIICPRCGVLSGQRCVTDSGRRVSYHHQLRRALFVRLFLERYHPEEVSKLQANTATAE